MSAIPGGHTVQAAPAVPHVARARGSHTPSWQQPLAQVAGPHPAAGSIMQSAEQPSPPTVFPSSHCSNPARTLVSPQTAGPPIVSSASTSRARCSATDSAPLLATLLSIARPSTRTRIVRPASVSGNRMASVSVPFVSGRGGSGSMPGSKAEEPSTKPATLSEVNP